MGGVKDFILREPQAGQVEVFIKTEDGKEFVYAIPRTLLWNIHNQSGAFLFRGELAGGGGK